MNPRTAPRWLLALVAGSFLATAPAAAQVELGVRASTLGLGLELGFRPTRAIGLRASGQMFSMTREEQVEGVDYELKPDLESFGATLDLYPFGKVLYFSGGMLLNRNTATADAIIGSTITLGSQTYTNSQVQALSADLDWNKSMAPYAGLGFVTGGRVGVSLEFGVVFSGKPTVDLAGTTTLTGSQLTAFNQAVADEEAEIVAWIDDNDRFTKYYPLVAFGLRFRF